MKKFIGLIALSMLFLAWSTVSAFEYKIITKSANPSFNGCEYILMNEAERITETIGEVKNGVINITGESNRTFPARLIVRNDSDESKLLMTRCVVWGGTIVLDWGQDIHISGGELNQRLNEYERRIFELPDDAHRAETRKEIQKEVFLANYNNGLGEYVLMDLGSYCSPQEWSELVAQLDDETKELEAIRDITYRMERLKNTWEGQPFVELNGKNLNGEDVALSDFVGKGKYVIADIWASWCGGCITEAKETLIPLYYEYKDNPNVQIIGIGYDDIKEAAKKHGMPWEQISDCDKLRGKYCIFSLPEIILFGPDGTILKRHLRSKQIPEILKSYLSNPQTETQTTPTDAKIILNN